MAVEAGHEETVALRKKKRKKSLSQRKLLDHERVEVRSEEDGFQGSWHSGVVIACDKQGFRSVKYDNVLVDDGSANVVDVVYVSPVLDGIDNGCVNSSNYRGHIRPLPPPYKFGKCDIHYGLCVDVYHLEAWWEGVVFDHEDGLEERYIFFPDIGDGMKAGIEKLRITQDWNEVTENWKKRGNWIFLELIQQYEQEEYLPVSVEQIWYDVRGKEGFEKLREWTSPMKDLWKELVLEVINDNLSITVEELFRVLLLPETLLMLESSQPVTDVNMDCKAETIHCSASTLADNLLSSNMVIDNEARIKDFLDCKAGITNELDEIVDLISGPNPLAMEPNTEQLSFVGKKDGSSRLLTDSDILNQHKAICVQPQALFMSPSKHDGTSTNCSVFYAESIHHNNANQINEKSKRSTYECATKWKSVTSEMLPEVQFCPDSVDEYYERYCIGKPSNLKSKTSAVKDVRKHLICLGWKFEYMRDKCTPRWRYISPDGKCFYSLRQVCKYLKESPTDLLSSISQDIHSSAHASSDDCFLSPPREPQESQPHASSDDYCILSIPGQLQVSQPHYLSDDCFLSMGQPEKSRSGTVVSPDSNTVGVTEYVPQAIVEYSQLRYHKRSKKMRNMIVKVKEHLSALKWKFSHSNTKGKDEWCYKSPTGKVYFSLQDACKGCLDERVLVDAKVKDKELRWKRNDHSLDDEHHICSTQTHRDARKGFLKNGLKGNSKLSHPNIQHASHLKLKRGKGLIKSRGGLDVSQSAHVLRSSKRVQEVVFPTSSYHNPRTMLSWLIDNNVVLPREKVYYISRKNRHIMAEGRISRDGIKCSCCNKVFTLSGFEVHAGSTYHRPAANIYLENGQSLIDCQRKIIGDRKTGNFRTELCDRMNGNWRQGENDYICSVCHYGGELMLCDQCPSSFHKSCLGLTVDIPDGDWFCPSCCCRICMERIFQNDIDDAIGESVTCGQCEHNYHIRCLRNKCTVKLESFHKGNWFCSKECKKISSGLQKLLGKPTAVGVDNLTWSILKPLNTDCQHTDVHHIDALMENDSKLNVALGLMHECFEPVKEHRTGRDIIEDVIFCRESDLSRLNFRGFYTVLLERNDELITVAAVRVHGQKVAEIPLVGTQFQYRRLGMCHMLMNELEKKLVELGVERLVLPAVPSVLNAWTTSFGFSQMTDSERLQFLDYTFLEFQDTIMCQKLLMKIPSAESRPLKGIELKVNDEICGGDNIDFDHSSAVSEVFQGDQIEDSGIVDQRQVKISAGDKSDGNDSPTDMVPMVKQTQDLECRPCDSETNPTSVCSMEDANFKRAWGNNGILVLKYHYKRRKKSAC
ncbi:hypothetical protein FEM48_Zijuj02G0104000 [Ziziphus jujuba var. spinosa]|uniref:Increased DNA methylation 1 n=1 Tax=Ziziphus jujuba var. spinosa TaxID=714518 RepID=A0A978VV74_ZIZJJ|nr:hypothetical protein FEM48_Zijuj02G0104000 [Ziziphus jujuba var. spinosa]